MSLMPRYCPKCGGSMRSGEFHWMGCPPRDDMLFGDSRWVMCPRCGKGHLAKTGCGCWKRTVPSNDDRAAYFTARRTSTAEQVKRLPLSSRLIDVAALAFLRGLALVDWVKRRVR